MPYKIAGIDVHKRMLAVVVADIAGEGEYKFERRKVGTSPDQLRLLGQWLVEQDAEEAVMESTAQYWKPVWQALERYWKTACQKREGAGTHSEFRARHRTASVADGHAQEAALTCEKVRLQNQLECLLEEAHIKLSSLVSDLLGVSAQRMLQALADGETNPETLAALADRRLRATPSQLCDALGACQQLNQVYRRLLKMALEELKLLEQQQDQLDKMISELLALHQDAVRRVAEIPGLGVDSAHQVIAEVGPTAAVFPSAKHLASWVGVCPGEEQSADQSQSTRSPKGNCSMRRILNQAAHAAVKVKGSIFKVVFRRLKARLEYQEAIWAIAHRICRLIWKILHENVRYEERGPEVSAKSKQTRTAKMIRQLRALGYRVEPTNLPASNPA